VPASPRDAGHRERAEKGAEVLVSGRRLLAVRLGIGMLAGASVAYYVGQPVGVVRAAGRTSPAPAASLAGKAAAPTPDPTKGIIKGNVPTFWLVLSSAAGIQEVRTENGQVAVEPGSYTLMRWMAETKDAAGHRWQARGGMWPKPIEIVAGRVTPLRLASPLRAVLRGFYNTNPVSFRLEFSGSEGELYEGVTLDGLNPPMPHLKITDGKGKQVADLEFKPG
jgi:hypothetical protein